MMPIYKTTLIKFLKSFSTWLPLGITLIIVALIGAILPFLFLDLQSPSIVQTYKLYIVTSVTTIGSATSIVSATFSSYKAVQIYKQEIEEGTFLILVSKPINRKRIVFEKWLALLTIVSLYVFVLISFYIFLVLAIDPGPKITNLDIEPIRNKIFQVGGILMGIILMLTLMFSSIALIFSSKISSSATIAMVAGLGAIIPITGLIPGFTNKLPQSMITRPANLLNATRIPRDETINFIQDITKNNLTIDKKNILDLFNKVNLSYKDIEDNKDNQFINNLSVGTGEKDIYGSLFFLDLNYQLSSIATIASDLLVSQTDRNNIAAGAMAGGFTQSPTLSGKINIVQKDVQKNELSKMLLNTLNKYKDTVESLEFEEGIFPFFDYILVVNGIPLDQGPTNGENFYNRFLQLMTSLGSENHEEFLTSPIISTILKDINILEEDKMRLQNRDNPFLGEIKAIETLLLLKINLEIGLGLNLIISNGFLDDFYSKNEYKIFSNYDDALLYLNELIINDEDGSLEEIINNFCYTLPSVIPNSTPNQYSILQLANTLLLTEKSEDGVNTFEFTSYANKWALFGIYSSITFMLLPISYWIIKKQDIR